MEEQKLRCFYTWIISICGFIIVFLIPPLAAPDEHTHFLNTYCFSQFEFGVCLNDNASQVGKYIPKYIDEFAKKYYCNYAMDLEDGYSFAQGYFDSWITVNDTDRELVFWEGNDINPLAYIFSGLGMKFVSLFCDMCGGGYDTAYNLMLAGRLANLFFYVFVGSWAIRITPCLKKTMMLVLGMPMSIFLGASLSYDAILIPVTMLFFAEFMYLYMKTDSMSVNIIDIFTIALCVLFLVSIKKVCAPFICLLLLLPKTKFKSLKQYLISIGVVIIIGIVALLPEIILHNSTTILENVKMVDTNTLTQKEFLYQNLQLIPVIIGNTFKEYSNFYLSGFVGKLGQLDTNFPILYIGMFWVVLLLVTIVESCNVKEKVNWKIKVATLVVVIVILAEMFIKMYISWTPYVREPFGLVVDGVQGRYFIPMYCFWFIILFNNLGNRLPIKIIFWEEKIINNVTLFSTIINCALTVIIILLRYWCY